MFNVKCKGETLEALVKKNLPSLKNPGEAVYVGGFDLVVMEGGGLGVKNESGTKPLIHAHESELQALERFLQPRDKKENPFMDLGEGEHQDSGNPFMD